MGDRMRITRRLSILRSDSQTLGLGPFETAIESTTSALRTVELSREMRRVHQSSADDYSSNLRQVR